MAADGTRRTKHWAFRLANVVLSDNLFMRLIETTARLNCKDLWKELASFYSICAANFRLSGTHERQFKPFVQGKMALLYLWYWLKERPEALYSARDQYKQAAVRVRSEHYKMLDDLCKRIDKIE
ncbi:hypothetical protein L914_00249 [Phytophthora nicotianae]|uniref:Uncharacterized protein n=1 Tax=Phytophthora nicotianae TaxID=4792 RepID=W2P847_PHYNI|nr:hypothetical protein L914_00249 [Phytophthora nicotianae]